MSPRPLLPESSRGRPCAFRQVSTRSAPASRTIRGIEFAKSTPCADPRNPRASSSRLACPPATARRPCEAPPRGARTRVPPPRFRFRAPRLDPLPIRAAAGLLPPGPRAPGLDPAGVQTLQSSAKRTEAAPAGACRRFGAWGLDTGSTLTS